MLAVGNMYPPHHLGGYELVWHAAMEHLQGREHEVRVLTTDFELPVPDASIPEPGYVRRTLRWYWRDHEFPRIGILERRRIESHNKKVFDHTLREFKPDVVSWWSMGGMSLGLLRQSDLPSLGVVHDDWPLYGPKVDGALDPSAVDAWSFNSRLQHARVRAALAGADGRVDHPGIDLRLFREAPPRAWSWQLLYCGRLDERKGVDLAVRALAELPDAHLRIVGDGDPGYREQLDALAKELEVEDRMTVERLRREQLPAGYEAADVVLFPVRWEEPWGLVPLEAMAVGRPVIASGRGGSAEYLEDGANCLLAPDGELAAAVRRLAEDQFLRSRLRRTGLETAARHSQAQFVEGIEAALKDVLAG